VDCTHANGGSEPLPRLIMLILVLITTLVSNMTPAFYARSWTPWLRYTISCTLIIVLIIVLRWADVGVAVPPL
jgi:hypothetical protein